MKNLESLLNKYRCKIVYEKDVDPAMIEVKPEDGLGIEIGIYGSFAKDTLDDVELTAFQVIGFIEDVPDSLIDEDSYYKIIAALLEGDYKYELKSITLWDKISGGAVYFSVVDDEGGNLLKDYRCVDQRNLKGLLQRGSLKSQAYPKK